MKIIKNETITEALKEFNCDLKLMKTLKYEPDCFIFLNNESGGDYILICRDLIQDDPEAEKKNLKNELGIETDS